MVQWKTRSGRRPEEKKKANVYPQKIQRLSLTSHHFLVKDIIDVRYDILV